MTDEQSWFSTVVKLRQTGQHHEALHQCDVALAHSPEDTDAMGFRAMLLYEMDRTHEALDAYQALARAFASQGDYLRALTTAKELAALAPEQSEDLMSDLASQYQCYQENLPSTDDNLITQDFPSFAVEATMPSLPSFKLPEEETEQSEEDEMVQRLLQLQQANDTMDWTPEHSKTTASNAFVSQSALPPLFRQLDAASTAAIWSSMETLDVQPGEYVIRQGETGRSFFIVAEGTVRVSRVVEDEEEELGYLGAGQFFGEIALLTTLKRTASVVAVSHCKILRLERESIESIILRHANVHQELQRFVYQRLIHNLLISSLLFFPLSDIKRWELAQQFNVLEVPEGFSVLAEGQHADGLYLIAGGKVRLERAYEDGTSQALSELEPGQFFGELSILTKRASFCSIVALESTTFLKLNAENFHRVLEQYPRVLTLLEAVAARRSRELSILQTDDFYPEQTPVPWTR